MAAALARRAQVLGSFVAAAVLLAGGGPARGPSDRAPGRGAAAGLAVPRGLHPLGAAETGTYWAPDQQSPRAASLHPVWATSSYPCPGRPGARAVAGAVLDQEIDPVTIWPRAGATYSLRLTVTPHPGLRPGDTCGALHFVPTIWPGNAVPVGFRRVGPLPRCYRGSSRTRSWVTVPCHAERVLPRPARVQPTSDQVGWRIVDDEEPGRRTGFAGAADGDGPWQFYLPVRMPTGRRLGMGRSFTTALGPVVRPRPGLDRSENEWGASLSTVVADRQPPRVTTVRQLQEVWANPRSGEVVAAHGGLNRLGSPSTIGLSESAGWTVADYERACGYPSGHAYRFPHAWLVAADTDPAGGHLLTAERAAWWLVGLLDRERWLGWPTSDARLEGGVVVQHFEHGTIRGSRVCVGGSTCREGATLPLVEVPG